VDSGSSHGSGSCCVECSPRNVLPTSAEDGVSMAKNVAYHDYAKLRIRRNPPRRLAS